MNPALLALVGVGGYLLYQSQKPAFAAPSTPPATRRNTDPGGLNFSFKPTKASADELAESLGYLAAGEIGNTILNKVLPGRAGNIAGAAARGAGVGAAVGNLVPIVGTGPGALIGAGVGAGSSAISGLINNESDPVADFGFVLPMYTRERLDNAILQLEALVAEHPNNAQLRQMLLMAVTNREMKDNPELYQLPEVF